MEQTVIDPVCGMAVAPDAFALTEAGIRHAFCSQQGEGYGAACANP